MKKSKEICFAVGHNGASMEMASRRKSAPHRTIRVSSSVLFHLTTCSSSPASPSKQCPAQISRLKKNDNYTTHFLASQFTEKYTRYHYIITDTNLAVRY